MVLEVAVDAGELVDYLDAVRLQFVSGPIASAVPEVRVDGWCEDVIFFDGVFFEPSLTSIVFAT